jgi:hypothetical protein
MSYLSVSINLLGPCPDKVTLFSAVTHRDSVTIAQVSVPAGTNEVTQAGNLLKSLDSLGIPEEDEVLVTLDAAHTCRETARGIKKRKQLDYLMNVKGNRPGLQAAVFAVLAPLAAGQPDDVVTEHARGRIRKWSCWITRANGINFPRHPRSRSSAVTSSRYQGNP